MSTHILDLPIEILAIITTQDLETFLCALKTPSIGQKMCLEYVQNYAKMRFISIIKTNINIRYYLCDELHRSDGTAVEFENGTKKWYVNGKLHRNNGPAVEFANGYKSWYQNGERHRDDGPAVEFANGSKKWYRHGKFITNTKNNNK